MLLSSAKFHANALALSLSVVSDNTRKYFILPHLSDPSTSFIKVFSIFNFCIFLNFHFKFIQN